MPKIRIAEVERIVRCIHFVKLVHVFNLLPFLHKQTSDVYNVQSSASACLGAYGRKDLTKWKLIIYFSL